jgi:hypothetical protein
MCVLFLQLVVVVVMNKLQPFVKQPLLSPP